MKPSGPNAILCRSKRLFRQDDEWVEIEMVRGRFHQTPQLNLSELNRHTILTNQNDHQNGVFAVVVEGTGRMLLQDLHPDVHVKVSLVDSTATDRAPNSGTLSCSSTRYATIQNDSRFIWNQQLLLKQALSHISNETKRAGIYVIFEVNQGQSDNVKKSMNDSKSHRKSQIRTICWAFLKLRSASGLDNLRGRFVLQLWYLPSGLYQASVLELVKGSARPYPSTVTVSLDIRAIDSGSGEVKSRLRDDRIAAVGLKADNSFRPNAKLPTSSDTLLTHVGQLNRELDAMTLQPDHEDPIRNNTNGEIVVSSEPTQSDAEISRIHNRCSLPNVEHYRAEGIRCSIAKFSNDGRRLACAGGLTASEEKCVRILLFSVPSMNIVGKLVGHSDTIRDMSWSTSDHKLCSASEDKTVRIWSTMTGIEINPTTKPTCILPHSDGVLVSRFHPSHKNILATTARTDIRIWCVLQRQFMVLQIINTHDFPLTCLDIHANGTCLASADNRGYLNVYRWPDVGTTDDRYSAIHQTITPTSYQFSASIASMRFHPTKEYLLIMPRNGSLEIYDVVGNATLLKFYGAILDSYYVNNIGFSACGSMVFAGDKYKGDAYFWDADTGTPLNMYIQLGFDGPVSSIDIQKHTDYICFACPGLVEGLVIYSCRESMTELNRRDRLDLNDGKYPRHVGEPVSTDAIRYPTRQIDFHDMNLAQLTPFGSPDVDFQTTLRAMIAMKQLDPVNKKHYKLFRPVGKRGQLM